MAKADVGASGGISLDQDFMLEFDGLRPHQVHLEGGDASSDSYCFSG
jgi:selenium-binding protein 1